ncbi:thioesterase II family protein [Streptomyces sp. NBC_01618]|uniref:thioesterase II family protein n=1 Tax=Streptomyces sp. NBC_01618 TaxID=2975900 RepID=UPI0038639753|nr:alpha/beta fold hydrolase [Streptomyces sp. NBC_01618]
MDETSGAESNRWLRVLRPSPGDARLVCFPHAGGNTTFYHPWVGLLPPRLELAGVRYPGNMERSGESSAPDIETLADGATRAILSDGDRPVVLFGHSLGALVAYEVAQRLEYQGRPPTALFLSGQAAPHHLRRGSVALRDDDDFWAAITTLGGIDEQVSAVPELRALALPGLRSDFRIAETYGPRPVRALHCPVIVFTGDADPTHAPAGARAWNDAARGLFRIQSFPGDHFFLVPWAAEATGVIAATVAELLSDQADTASCVGSS